MHAVYLAYSLGFSTFVLFGIFVIAGFLKSKRVLNETVKYEEKV